MLSPKINDEGKRVIFYACYLILQCITQSRMVAEMCVLCACSMRQPDGRGAYSPTDSNGSAVYH